MLLQPERSDAILSCLGDARRDGAETGRDAEAAAEMTLLFACGCLQNLCHDPLWSELLVQRGYEPRMRALLEHPNAQVVRYAAGALKNLSVTLDAQLDGSTAAVVEQRTLDAEVEALRYRRAMRRIARGFRTIPPALRLQRVLAAQVRDLP